VTLTTDVIVGFPGETDAEFEETLSAVREVGFADAYTFIFSPRDGTPATRLPPELNVPAEVASERLQRLVETVRAMSRQRNMGLLGTRHEVLVEREAKRGEGSAPWNAGRWPIPGERIPAARHEVDEPLSDALGRYSMVAQDACRHRLDLGPIAVQLGQSVDESDFRIRLSPPGSWIGRRVETEVMRRARGEQGPLVREVRINRRAADTGPLGNRGHRRGQRSDLLVQLHRGLGDPPPRLVHSSCAALEPIRSPADAAGGVARDDHLIDLPAQHSVLPRITYTSVL